MQKFTRLTGVAAPLLRAGIDTGTIIQSVWLRSRSFDLCQKLFSDWRYDAEGEENPDFVLNQPRSILIDAPGDGAAVMTTLEGHKMAQAGRAGAALAAAALAFFIAGTLGVVALTVISVPLARFSLRFGPAEYFMLMFFALTFVSALAGNSRAKAVFAVAFGLMHSTIGIDLQTGESRFTLGIPELDDELHFPAVVVGLFAVSEVLRGLERWTRGQRASIRIQGKLMLTREEWRRARPSIFRGGFIGFVVGVLPGAGSTIATVLAYATESRVSRHRKEFGKGATRALQGWRRRTTLPPPARWCRC